MKRFFFGLCALVFLIAAPTTNAQTITTQDLAFTTKPNGTVVVQGNINTTTYPTAQSFKISLTVGSSPIFNGSEKIYTPNTPVGTDGNYAWEIPNLAPGTTYHFKQRIVPGALAVPQEKVFIYTTEKAVTPASTSSAASLQADFDARSYRLLAPFPGLSVLLDPDLCQEQKLAGKNGQICDINEFLNYIFNLLVGLSAVALVLRLIYEGYQYIVTDIPFLKASAKGGFMEALGGLALALSAYLILNTLNPKLVQNDINVAKVGVGVEIVDIESPDYAYNDRTRPGTTGGTKLSRILTNNTFPNAEWQKAALAAVKNSQLPTLKPRDAATFFPNGQVTPENWVKLLAGIAYLESGYNPKLTYIENFKDSTTGTYVVSTGLLQISQGSVRGYKIPGFTLVTTEQLKDPSTNLQVSIKILEHWVQRDGVISGRENGKWRGGARYWSTLRF